MAFTVMKLQGNSNQWIKLSNYSSEQQAMVYAKTVKKQPNVSKVKIIDDHGSTVWID